MPAKREGFNPFYALLIVLGIAFSLTACAYMVMMLRGISNAEGVEAESPLMTFLEQRGGLILGIELALLAVATFGAIGTDSFWQRRAAQNVLTSPEAPRPPDANP